MSDKMPAPTNVSSEVQGIIAILRELDVKYGSNEQVTKKEEWNYPQGTVKIVRDSCNHGQSGQIKNVNGYGAAFLNGGTLGCPAIFDGCYYIPFCDCEPI